MLGVLRVSIAFVCVAIPYSDSTEACDDPRFRPRSEWIASGFGTRTAWMSAGWTFSSSIPTSIAVESIPRTVSEGSWLPEWSCRSDPESDWPGRDCCLDFHCAPDVFLPLRAIEDFQKCLRLVAESR